MNTADELVKNKIPLAARLRPQSLTDFFEQTHLLAEKKPLRMVWETGHLHSMIFWGPPGTGKTTLGFLLASRAQLDCVALSAVTASVKDIHALGQKIKVTGKSQVLFLDEIHRFNKAQQDALLPYMESGDIILMGATTENPSFALNNALLSRARVYVLKALSEQGLLQIIERAWQVLNANPDIFPQNLREYLAQSADGDARRLLNDLDTLWALWQESGDAEINSVHLANLLQDRVRAFDNKGEYFHDAISALHKSIRGSSPDAALYWFARMIDGGCDPLYIARRLVRAASEDIGNADPRALTLALAAWDVQQRLGSPEGELALAQTVLYLATAAKSNASYVAWQNVQRDVKRFGAQPVPVHLRNAPTKLMKELGYGRAYRYAHDEPYAYAAGENYWPETMKPEVYYQPTDRGLEKQIKEKLSFLRALDKSTKKD